MELPATPPMPAPTMVATPRESFWICTARMDWTVPICTSWARPTSERLNVLGVVWVAQAVMNRADANSAVAAPAWESFIVCLHQMNARDCEVASRPGPGMCSMEQRLTTRPVTAM